MAVECANCLYSRKMNPDMLIDFYYCHRYPPMASIGCKPSFPIMEPENWCGEYKPKPDERITD